MSANFVTFEFTLSEGALVYINTRGNYLKSGVCLFYNSWGEATNGWTLDNGSPGGWFALPAGKYWITVGATPERSSGWVNVSYDTYRFDLDGPVAYEMEDNYPSDEVSISEVATPLNVGTYFVGTLLTAPTGVDGDYYSFTIGSRQHVKMTLTSAEHVLFALEDDDGNVLKRAEDSISLAGETTGSDTQTVALDFGILDPGTYYILVIYGDEGAIGQPYIGQLWQDKVERLGGDTRVDTMALIAQEGFSKNYACDTILVATAYNYADALTASALAGALGAPLITTNGSMLDAASRSQIARLANGDTKVYVLGGSAAVSNGVVSAIRGIAGIGSVDRIYGDGRVETGSKIYEKGAESGLWGKTCVVANAWNYADALAGVNLSAPILLVDSSDAARQIISSVAGVHHSEISRAYILGGTAAVSGTVEGWLEGRLAGL